MTANASGPGVAIPRPATTITAPTKAQHPESNPPGRLPVVFAWQLRAVAGATFDRVMVRACCWCGFAHLHYVPVGSRLEQIVRSPRCARHRHYAIEIVDVIPAAAVPGQRRRAGAA
jgi:hypothetical protein